MNDNRLPKFTSRGESDTARSGCCALETGLYLEDRHILLPWGARLAHLAGDCQPTRRVSAAVWDELYWQRPLLFGGLRARSLQVVIYRYGWLDAATLWMERGCCRSAAVHAFERAREHLSRILWQPGPGGILAEIERQAVWEQPHWRAGLFLRRGTLLDGWGYACVLHISHRNIN